MARTVAQIQQSIIDEKNNQSALSGLNSPSQTAIWLLWTFIVAVCIAIHEQLWDIFKTDLEKIAARAVPGTAKWLQNKVLEFQYSATNPQIVEVDPESYTVSYPSVDPSLRIITRCSVKQSGNKVVSVKVAKGNASSLEPLTSDEKTALTDYLNDIRFAGTEIVVVSEQPDRVKVTGTIYYKGQFLQSVVKANVISAINNFLSTFSLDDASFDGTMYLTKLVDAVQNVPGVVDFTLSEVKGRSNSQPIGSAFTVTRTYESVAGYIIAEDTSGSTLDDTLTMELSV